MKIPVVIDGKRVEVNMGTTVLNAAREAGIVIPTLCHHEALRPYGACRLCTVEIVHHRTRRLVTSCNCPAEAGMEVSTDTAPVRKVRRMLAGLLLARCPDVPAVQSLARSLGVEETGLKMREDKVCILCGLCVRFCEEVVGASAIGLANRGTEREVATPFNAPSEACIGCGSCTFICPTGCIEMVPDGEDRGRRRMNMGHLSLPACTADYACSSCETDRQFIEDIKSVIESFRNSPKG